MSRDDILGLVYHVCFNPNYFQGKTQALKEDLTSQACVCTMFDMRSIAARTLCRPAVDRAVNAFGPKCITNRCAQTIGYAAHSCIADGVAFVHASTLTAGLYASPDLCKPFFEHKVHLALLWSL